MKRSFFYYKLFKYLNSSFIYTYNKRNVIYYESNLKYILTHKGMWLLKLPINSHHHKKRIGELVFTRKPYKRPAKFTKKRKCYLNIYIELIFLKNIWKKF